MAAVLRRRRPREAEYPSGDGKPVAETKRRSKDIIDTIQVLAADKEAATVASPLPYGSAGSSPERPGDRAGRDRGDGSAGMPAGGRGGRVGSGPAGTTVDPAPCGRPDGPRPIAPWARRLTG
jgi:hypothetical protein